MNKLLCFILCCMAITASAQNYAVTNIPDSLTNNADAVKRIDEMKVTIFSLSRVLIKHRYAYTILNESGARFAHYHGSYDNKFFNLNSIDGKLFDAAGKQLKSVKKKDIADFSQQDGMSLMTDQRIKQHSFYYSVYPYTVEYEDEIEYDGTMFLPAWTPVPSDRVSVQNSTFSVQTPVDYKLRFKQQNYPTQVSLAINDHNKQYTWSLSNYPALVYEDFQPDLEEITPWVALAPSEFVFGGLTGSMTSWKDLGMFSYQLYKGRDKLPPTISQQVHEIADRYTNPADKTKALYEYLQKQTRYISIQLGIGGWQPFEASFVAEKKYGDCKALSNYMVAMLKEAGVTAYPVIIKSGEDESKGLIEDFPFRDFNHVVVCVPMKNDTMWLECTSQTESAGFMGSFTGNRKAMMVTENGGYVVSTPTYGINDNLQLRSIKASIDANGNLSTEVNTRFTGQSQEDAHRLIHYYTAEEKQKYLNARINLPTYKVEKFDYKETKGRIPVVDEYLVITSPSYAAVTGKRMFIQPNLFNKTNVKLSTEKPRKFPIKYSYPFRDIDTVQIEVPSGYKPESVPKDVALKTRFGNYSISFAVKENRIMVIRLRENFQQSYPASDYLEFANFQDTIYKADRSKIVLVKQE